MMWEAARLAAAPAMVSVRASLWAASNGWQVMIAPLPRLTKAAPGTAGSQDGTAQQPLATADVDSLGAWWFLSLSYWWDFIRRGLSQFGRVARFTLHISLALALACILYALPVCGTSLRAPLHLLPIRLGEEALGEVEVGLWAATLAAGSVVVDIDLELTVPNSQFNFQRSMEAMSVDLELEKKQVSRPLVLPHLSAAAQQLRELFWAVPMAFGLCYDEQVVRLPLASGILPQELVRHVLDDSGQDVLRYSDARRTLTGGSGGLARLRLAPALVVRAAEIRFQPRFAGPLGRPLSSFLGFVPICACLIYLGRFRRSEAPAPHEQRGSPLALKSGRAQLSYVEVQMLAKALGGSFSANFTATVDAFEAEDRAAHGGKLQGQVKLDRLPMVTGKAEHEWLVFDEWDVRSIIGTTLALPPAEGGLVTPGGCLQYRLWLAITTVSLLCGSGKFADLVEWVVRHECGSQAFKS